MPGHRISRFVRAALFAPLHRAAHARPRTLVMMLAAALAACESPAKPIPVASVVLSPLAPSVIVGTPQQFTATARDAQGATLAGRAAVWSSLSTTTANVSASGLVSTISPGVATIQATVEGIVGATTITVMPVPVAAVIVSPTSATVVAGATQALAVATRDAQGGLLTDRVVLWNSTAPSIATVASNGVVTGLAPGTAVVQAVSEGITGTATITVLPPPVASVSVTLPAPVAVIGTNVQATAVLRDAGGATLTGRTVTWSSNSPAVATVSATGLVSVVTGGTTTITATSEGRSGSADLTAQTTAFAITSITPATLVPGSTATIAVTGFNPSVGTSSVTIGGAAAALVSATPNQLVVTVPCARNGSTTVQVANPNITTVSRTHAIATTQLTVPLGQAVVLASAPTSACNELASTGGPARFLVAVFSIATSQNTLSAFELAGNPASAGAPAPRVLAPLPSALAGPLATLAPSPIDEAVTRYERQHAIMLERNRVDYQRLMGEYLRMSPAQRTQSQASATRDRAADVAVGDMRSIFFTFSGGCNDSTRVIRAKAIRTGSRSIIWEDSANTLQSDANADLAGFYARAGQIYDQEQHASVTRSFGDPLRRDAVTDNDGKVHMVFSQRLNGSGAAAYVTGCDQFPTSANQNAGSNFGQFFYGAVPTTASLNINSTNSPDGWFYFMVRTIVHEVKHIASLSARVANSSPSYEQSWLEEGTARQAEEMWVRESLHRVGWKANTGFGTAATNGLYCDFHPTDATCNAGDPLRRPGYGMRRQFNEIRDKLIQPWNWSPFGDGTGQSGAIFYNTTWSLVRYVADRYATSDTAFLRALTNSTNTGVTNLSAIAGVSLDQLLGGWGLALFADDYPGLASPSADLQFPTWNLRNIYAGLNAAPAWSARWNTPFPIQPTQLTFGPFVSPVPSIRGGAHAYFEFSGNFTQSQLLDLRGSATTPASSNLRIAITRLQ